MISEITMWGTTLAGARFTIDETVSESPSMSLSLVRTLPDIALSRRVVNESGFAIGASFVAATEIVTVATSESTNPSFAR